MDFNQEYDLFIKSIVDYVKSKFPKFVLDTDDLYQAGWDELIKANEKYDPAIAKLTTYAKPAVEHRIMKEAITQINSSISCDFILRTPMSVEQDLVEIADKTDESEEESVQKTLYDFVKSELSESEYKVFTGAHGIRCERCSDPEVLGKQLGMSENEVYLTLEQAKRKLGISGHSKKGDMQILEVLKDISDEYHSVSQARILEEMTLCGFAATENPATLKKKIENFLFQLNPVAYSPERDSEYVIKYKGYENNLISESLQKRKSANIKRRKNSNSLTETTAEKGSKKSASLTDFHFVHLFSMEEMDRLIHLVAFSDSLTTDEKTTLIRKIMSTASRYYTNPLFDRQTNTLRFDAIEVIGRKSAMPDVIISRMDSAEIGENVRLIQNAINQKTQIGFHYNRYHSDKSLVPNKRDYQISPYHIVVYHDMYFLLGRAQDKDDYLHFRIDLMSEITALRDEEGMPLKRASTIRPEVWDPEKYMSEHLYMGYEKPRHIRIKIPEGKITVIHNWFGSHYTTPKATPTEEGFVYVDVLTSPSFVVQWAMQYYDIVEIMDEDIREKIREALKKAEDKYSK